jgi:hypothetical protein
MSSKINLIGVLKSHLKTFHNSDGKISLWDYAFFLAMPGLLSFSVVLEEITFDADIISLLLNFGAIFTALLLSLLVLVYDQESKLPESTSTEPLQLKAKRRVLNELYNNISYSIFTSILIVALCFLLSVLSSFEIDFLIDFLEWWLTFFAVNLLLTILMVLKRMHSLLTIKV